MKKKTKTNKENSESVEVYPLRNHCFFGNAAYVTFVSLFLTRENIY